MTETEQLQRRLTKAIDTGEWPECWEEEIWRTFPEGLLRPTLEQLKAFIESKHLKQASGTILAVASVEYYCGIWKPADPEAPTLVCRTTADSEYLAVLNAAVKVAEEE